MRYSFCNCNATKKFHGKKNKFKIYSFTKCGHGYASDTVDEKFLHDYYGSKRRDTTFEDDLLSRIFLGLNLMP